MQITITGRTITRVLLGLLIAAVLGGLAWGAFTLLRPGDPIGNRVDPDRYQAVFLQGGQIYFGHLREAPDGFFELRDAFFIREIPGENEEAPPTQEVRPVTEEFHQPDGHLLFPREVIVRVDNLAPDSEVALAIDRVRQGS